MAKGHYLKEARSPYHKYKKAPFKYSEVYVRWSKLVRNAADPDEIEAADRAFRRHWGIPRFDSYGRRIDG